MINLASFIEMMGEIREPNEEGTSLAFLGFETSFQAYLSAPQALDKDKILALAIVYNLGNQAEKLSNATQNPILSNLYQESQYGTSSEVDFVHWINGKEAREDYPESSLYLHKYKTKISSIINELNELKRSGWKMREVKSPESVAEHSYAIVLQGLLFSPPHLNHNQIVNIALVHDIQEALAGDYTPFDKITPEEKNRIELKYAIQISKNLNCPKMLESFLEYENCQTPEAKMIKDIDRVDAVLLAQYYDNHKRGKELMIPEFLTYAEKKYIGGYNCEIVNDIYIHLRNQDKNRLNCVSNVLDSLRSSCVNHS